MGKRMDEQALRTWLARQLRQPDVPDVIWEILVEELYVREAMDGLENGREGLLAQARKQMRVWRSAKDHARCVTRTAPANSDKGVITPYEFERQYAVATYLAHQAEMSDPVRTFRAKFFGANTPTTDEMSQMQAEGVDEPDYQDDPLVTSSPSYGLDDLVSWLNWRYGWNQADATDFLEAGRPPVDPPIPLPIDVQVEDTSRPERKNGRIVLLVEPWVSPETVLRVYRRAQHWALGGKNRPIQEKNLKLFEFVERQKLEGQRPPWSTLIEQWNEAYPTQSYSDIRHFARDYERTRKALLLPKYTFLHTVEGGEA